MVATDERVRFCAHCNAVVGWYATFCSDCGLSLTAERKGKREDAAPQGREREYFRAQMRICHRAREEALHLTQRIATQAQRVGVVEGKRATDATRRELLLCSEHLTDLEHEWEEIQRRFNAATVSLEEVMSAEIADLAANVDLSSDQANAIAAEGAALEQDLAAAEEQLCLTRRERDAAQARHKHAWSGLATGGRGTTVLGLAALGAAGLGAAFGIGVGGVDPQTLVLSLLPAWIGILLLFLNARAKSL